MDNIEKEETSISLKHQLEGLFKYKSSVHKLTLFVESKLINEQSKQRINQLESVIQENEQQIRMLRDTIQGYEKQSAEEHQEIYRLQDVVKQLQALLTEKSNLIDTQALSILSKLYMHLILCVVV